MPMDALTVAREDQIAQRKAARRRRTLEKLGWTVRRNWDQHGPVTRLAFGTWLVMKKPAIDHLSRWVHRATGRTLYVSEPYADAFTLDDVHTFAEAHGFVYAVSDALSLHYPDYTRAVFFWRGDFSIDDLLELDR